MSARTLTITTRNDAGESVETEVPAVEVTNVSRRFHGIWTLHLAPGETALIPVEVFDALRKHKIFGREIVATATLPTADGAPMLPPDLPPKVTQSEADIIALIAVSDAADVDRLVASATKPTPMRVRMAAMQRKQQIVNGPTE